MKNRLILIALILVLSASFTIAQEKAKMSFGWAFMVELMFKYPLPLSFIFSQESCIQPKEQRTHQAQ